MKLRGYLDQNDTTPARFAKAIGVSVAALHRYMNGDRVPRPEILRRIISTTGGAVQPNDFFSPEEAS